MATKRTTAEEYKALIQGNILRSKGYEIRSKAYKVLAEFEKEEMENNYPRARELWAEYKKLYEESVEALDEAVALWRKGGKARARPSAN